MNTSEITERLVNFERGKFQKYQFVCLEDNKLCKYLTIKGKGNEKANYEIGILVYHCFFEDCNSANIQKLSMEKILQNYVLENDLILNSEFWEKIKL